MANMKYTTKTRGGGETPRCQHAWGVAQHTFYVEHGQHIIWGGDCRPHAAKSQAKNWALWLLGPKPPTERQTANRIAVNPKVFRRMKEGSGQKPRRAYRLQPLGFEVIQARRLGRTLQ